MRAIRWSIAGASAVAIAAIACSTFEGEDETGRPAPGGDDAAVSAPDAASREDAGEVLDGGAAIDASKRVFVTSSTVAGRSNGFLVADAMCKAAAVTAGLGGDWVAWISITGKPAPTRLPDAGDWYRLDGVRVGTLADLETSALAAPIDVLEDGGKLDAAVGVWTGTQGNGRAGDACSGWSDAGTTGTSGLTSRNDVGWTAAATDDCANALHLYCFER